ncbi:hypothetical protein Ancab_036574 [Ancistrocladus abbreviatus]
MHHLPKIFAHRKERKSMDETQSPRKLVRRNAAKHFDYTPSRPPSSPSSSTTSSTRNSSARQTRSLEIPHSWEKSSFRIEGNDGELNLLYRSLGLSGPEDFEIPKAAWEAMKSRSSSDVTPRTKFIEYFDELEEPQKHEVEGGVDGLCSEFEDSVRVGEVIEANMKHDDLGQQCSDGNTGGSDGIKGDRPPLLTPPAPPRAILLVIGDNDDLCNGFDDKDGVDDVIMPSKMLGDSRQWSSDGNRGGDEGIKGNHPTFLSPPPAMSLPALDNISSTWELVKSFAPDDDEESPLRCTETAHSSDNDEGKGMNADLDGRNGVRLGETVLLSGSCSFTTSHDDDSSSTTTDPVSVISPNGRFRAKITFWQKGELLGQGSFGKVYKAISSEGFFFAVKEVSLLEQGSQGKQSIGQLEQEIELLSQFEHENIVRYLGTDKDESKLYIFLELVTQGSLASLYQRYHLRDSHVSSYTRQILLGLKYLHDKNVVHRDIKCANILVASTGIVKLADFGLAKATKLNDLKSCKGTAFWMAPEVVNQKNHGYGLPADIWSLGCTVLEMLTHHVPYHPLEFMQALFRIGRGAPPPVPQSLSRDAHHFIMRCLQVNPNDRPTAAELLSHPFVRRPLSTSGSESPQVQNPLRLLVDGGKDHMLFLA